MNKPDADAWKARYERERRAHAVTKREYRKSVDALLALNSGLRRSLAKLRQLARELTAIPPV